MSSLDMGAQTFARIAAISTKAKMECKTKLSKSLIFRSAVAMLICTSCTQYSQPLPFGGVTTPEIQCKVLEDPLDSQNLLLRSALVGLSPIDKYLPNEETLGS